MGYSCSHSAAMKNPAERMPPKIGELEVLITLSIFHANESVPDRPERSHVRPKGEPFNNVSGPVVSTPDSPGYQSSSRPRARPGSRGPGQPCSLLPFIQGPLCVHDVASPLPASRLLLSNSRHG